MTMIVQKPGLLATIQDLGRFGFQKYGVIASGAMDPFAHSAANVLVGNEEAEATIEMTVIGASLMFTAPAVIALCGADMSPTVDGLAIPMWRPVYIREGAALQLGASHQGCRCYLAIAGGFDVPQRMESRSTYLRAGIGGLAGRALQAGDRLTSKPASALGARIAEYLLCTGSSELSFIAAPWLISSTILPDYLANPVVRVVAGAQARLFTEASLGELYETDYKVLPQSDRMGYRLAGNPLQLREKTELLSEPVTLGTVQVPPDGQPIVLMADRQTTGGYPKIAQIISADIPLMAQAQIGSSIRFQPVDQLEAQEALLIDRYNLHYLKASLKCYVY